MEVLVLNRLIPSSATLDFTGATGALVDSRKRTMKESFLDLRAVPVSRTDLRSNRHDFDGRFRMIRTAAQDGWLTDRILSSHQDRVPRPWIGVSCRAICRTMTIVPTTWMSIGMCQCLLFHSCYNKKREAKSEQAETQRWALEWECQW
jgi:hypothetical protein